MRAATACTSRLAKRSVSGVCGTRRRSAAKRTKTRSSRSVAAPWVKRDASVSLTQVLLGANVMVFIAMVIASGPSLDFTNKVMYVFGADFGPYTLSGQWWRLVTYMFLHGGLMHIAFNMWCLWDLGALCESLYGRWTFGAIYLITGIFGGLASVGWHPMIPSVGASGAIFGLVGALIASLYLGEFSLPSYVIRANLKSLLFFAGFNILLGISPIGNLFGIRVDNACHVGGLVSGLILGALIALAAPAHDKPLPRIGVLLFVVVLLAGSAVGVHGWRGSGRHFASAMDAQRNIDRLIGELQKKIQQNPPGCGGTLYARACLFHRGTIPRGSKRVETGAESSTAERKSPHGVRR